MKKNEKLIFLERLVVRAFVFEAEVFCLENNIKKSVLINLMRKHNINY